ncbi:hypothetical protein [Compostibacter hankyongensis]|uniref:Uncharacterized protein n=1 Tax=Compostibacter hankyongensis TaxID=1007089 RepID=A0ABP8G824_9BACT
MRFRKYIFPLLALAALAVLLTMYRRQQVAYRKTLAVNRSLVQQVNTLQQREKQLSAAMQQISGRRDEREFEPAAFVDRKKYFRMNWKNYIHVSLNNYKTGLLGGIHHIAVVVANDTEYPLDNVRVKLSYQRAGGEVFKTELVTVQHIPAKQRQTLPAPESRKGMKVSLSLLGITSQPMNFCWSPGKPVRPGEADPYRCAPE